MCAFLSVSVVAARADPCLSKVTVFYVNGIHADIEDAELGRLVLQDELKRYLPAECATPRVFLSWNISETFWGRPLADILEAAEHYFWGVNADDPDLTKHLGNYRAALDSGRRVIVLSHSQGNFYANAAHDTLRRERGFDLHDVFTIVGVATPDQRVGDDTSSGAPYVTLHEDPIKSVPFSLPPNETAPCLRPGEIDAHVRCHRFVESYLTYDDARHRILNLLAASFPNRVPAAGFSLSSIGHPDLLSSPPASSIPTLTITAGGGCVCALIGSDGRLPHSSDSDGLVTSWKWIVDGATSSILSTFSTSLSVGTHTISLIVTDDEGAASAPATIKVIVLPAVGPSLPSAVDDNTYSMFQGTTFSVPVPGVLSNDTYPVGATVEFLAPLPLSVAAANPDGSFTIDLTSDPTFTGTIALSYVIHSLTGDSGVATVAVAVEAYSQTSQFSILDLGTLGGSNSTANDVCNSGLVVGASDINGDAARHAFVWAESNGMVDIGTLGSGTQSAAVAVNDHGMVIGYSSTVGASQMHGFVWTATGGMLDLGPEVYPVAVNNSGTVVGWIRYSAAAQTFTWSASTGLVNLDRPIGMTHAIPRAINDSGVIVGMAVNGAAATSGRPTVWTSSVGWTVIETPLGSSEAWDINDAGLAAGVYYSLTGEQRAFIWTRAGGLVDIGHGVARAVGPSGHVVGASVGSDRVAPFSWTKAGGLVEVPNLGGLNGDAKAVNRSGLVVGLSTTLAEAEAHAFAWAPTIGTVDLGTLGGPISDANSVSDSGIIAGWSKVGGASHATVWLPVVIAPY